MVTVYTFGIDSATGDIYSVLDLDLVNAYFDIRPSNFDDYCGCNCHKYTCTPNPDTYDCKHCYPDRYFDTSPAITNGYPDASAGKRPLHESRP